MSNAITRTQSYDRFYNPPPARLDQLVRMQKQLHRALNTSKVVDSDDSTFSTNVESYLTNLDRIIESVTPTVPAQCSSEARFGGWRTREADMQPFFHLGDLWESFKEWSMYGVGVPLLLSGNDNVKQYYVPSLSGIQLYVEPSRLSSRRHGDNSEVESSCEASTAGSSGCEAEKRAKGEFDVVWGGHTMNLNFQGFEGLNLRDCPLNSSSTNETAISSSNGLLVYEYMEQEQPHHRKPLYDKVSTLASKFPAIKTYRSCDLLPASWVSVAWYPIYRIPMGPTLQNLDASFLTFHSLSTHSRSKNQVQFDKVNGRKAYGMVASSKIALPVFGLASYKLRGSILTPGGTHERQQANSLLQAADNWLQGLEINLPDFQFFVSHNSKW